MVCIITDPKITMSAMSSQLNRPNLGKNQPPYRCKMARKLNPWQRKMIVHMISSKNRLTTSQMAKLAKCSERSITNIRKNMRLFGSPNSPTIPPGPPPSITPVMLDALCDHLAEIPGLYIEEMAKFL